MEQELYKTRNVSKCVKAAYTLFNTNFKRIFSKLWLPFLVLSMLLAWNVKTYLQSLDIMSGAFLTDNQSIVLYGIINLLTLVAYVWMLANVFHLLNVQGLRANVIKIVKLLVTYMLIGIVIGVIVGAIAGGLAYYFKPSETTQPLVDGTWILKVIGITGVIGVMIFLLLIPLYYVFMQFMIEDRKLRQLFFPSLKEGFRHWGFLFVIYFVITLIALVFIGVIMMPVFVLVISQVSALKSMAMGDPSGLPSYFGWLYFITFTVVYFIVFHFITWALFVLYYAYGSIRRNEMDRESQKKELPNQTHSYQS